MSSANTRKEHCSNKLGEEKKREERWCRHQASPKSWKDVAGRSCLSPALSSQQSVGTDVSKVSPEHRPRSQTACLWIQVLPNYCPVSCHCFLSCQEEVSIVWTSKASSSMHTGLSVSLPCTSKYHTPFCCSHYWHCFMCFRVLLPRLPTRPSSMRASQST